MQQQLSDTSRPMRQIVGYAGHLPSLIRVFAVRFMGSKEPNLSSCGQEDSDQTGRMQYCRFCHAADHFFPI